MAANLKVGTKLANGALVLAVKRDLVLAFWQGHAPFVTWRVDEDLNAHLGHYHDDLDEALAEFDERANSIRPMMRQVYLGEDS